MSLRHIILATAALGALTAAPLAAKNPMVGGAAMYPTKNIVQNAVNSKDHTTLVAAVKVAGLVDTLSGPGPFTVFAPTNEAFAALPAGTVEPLLKPENKDQLTKILTCHVVGAKAMSKDIMKMVDDDKGAYRNAEIQGDVLPGFRGRDGRGGLEALLTAGIISTGQGVSGGQNCDNAFVNAGSPSARPPRAWCTG